MSENPAPVARLAERLASRNPLDDQDRAAIAALPFAVRSFEPNAYLVREGEPPRKYCQMVMSGFAFRQKLTTQGARQIVALHMASDIMDLQQLFLRQSDHNIQALIRLETAEFDREALREIAIARPNIGKAMWIETAIEASVFREWIVNIGRRDARARIAHLLCECAVRMEAAGIATRGSYELPLTQEQLGDATGLTSVHVNRTLKSLAAEGLVHRDKRYLSFKDWQQISAVADFSSLYLHLDQNGVEP